MDTFRLSTDPNFEAKVIDVVALYLKPPGAVAVFGFDKKAKIQALWLDRTQPSLPMKPSRPIRTHDYKRNGTIDLFTAMNLATGEVPHDTRKSHTGTGVLAFFGWIDVPDRPRDSCGTRQPVGPQVGSGEEVVGEARSEALASAYHADVVVVAELHRDLVLGADPQGTHEHELHLSRRANRPARMVDRKLERRPATLRLDQDRRSDRHQSSIRPSNPRPRNQICDTPLDGVRSMATDSR